MRPFLIPLIPLACGCLAAMSACSFEGTPDPSLSAKDAQWMARVPPAEEDPAFGRYEVQYATAEARGTIIIDPKTRSCIRPTRWEGDPLRRHRR